MKNNKPLFIPYITAGFPTKKSFVPILHTLSINGVDYIEVGVPYSDPLADGPVIQQSSKEALDNGVSLKWILNKCRSIPKRNLKPLILFSYFNPVLKYGLEKLLRDLPKPLFYGLIIPDLPFEEAEKYSSLFKKYNLNLILLAAPTTKKNKLKKVVKLSGGFIYLVSVVGTTGMRKKLSLDLREKIKELNSDGIILSGGPASVYEVNAPSMDKKILDLGVPILGICYGHQLIGKLVGGDVLGGKLKEFGKKFLYVKKNGKLLKGLSKKEQIWMSHGDLVTKLPEDFDVLAETDTCKIAAFENNNKKLYGIQFHAEVAHTLKGNQILKNFIFDICKTRKDWKIVNLPKRLIQQVADEVGKDSVIMAVSGGIDSTTAATLIHKAIGNKLYCVFIDHGLIRKGESGEVKNFFEKKLKFRNFFSVDASKKFLERLRCITDPEEKRKVIGHAFIEVFENKVIELEKSYPEIKFLGQGTIYPDRIESAQPTKYAVKIKSHHNITLPEKMKLKVIEPLKEFYKDEVRKLGKELKIPDEILHRHPFPGPGLAIRILGEITQERLRILREADYIFIEELKKSGFYDKIWQAFAALLPVKTVGVMGDARTYEYIISLRAVTSIDAMTADWAKLPNELLEKISNRIINEVRGVNRIVYDISQKPPATIEYE